jgi:drug/metabolite transporter (DMT)-like permease
VVYLLATLGALSSAIAGVLQRMGIEKAPATDTMKLRLLTQALRRGIWLLGFALLLVTFVLQATALRFGDLSVVQPVATLDLLFVVFILAVFFHRKVGWREITGSLGVVAGLAGFLVLAHPSKGLGIPTEEGWVVITVIVAVVTAVLVVSARHGPRWARAAVYGAAAAMLFAYNGSLTKATTTIITHGWGHVFTSWEPYALLAAGGFGFFLLQNALHAGPLAASRAAMVIVGPLVGVAIGVTIFHEHPRSGAGFVVAEVLALLVMVSGAFLLTQSPLVTGDSPEDSEMLSEPMPELAAD